MIQKPDCAPVALDLDVGVLMVCRKEDQEACIAKFFAEKANLATGIPVVTVTIPRNGLSRRYTERDFPRTDAECGNLWFVKWRFV